MTTQIKKIFYKLMRAEGKPDHHGMRRLTPKQIEIFKAEVSRIRDARLAAGQQPDHGFRGEVSQIRDARIAA